MAEKRLIYAEDVIRHLEKWIIEAEKCEAASTYIVATTLKHVLKLVNLAPTAHPPCTYLSNAGARHLWKGHQLQADRVMLGIQGRDLFMRFWSGHCKSNVRTMGVIV